MKKFFLSAILALCALPMYANNDGGNGGNQSKKDDDRYAIVFIRDDMKGDTRSRSVIGMPVSAYLDAEMGNIEVIFDIPEGTATTTIVNAFGQAVYRYTCDSEIEWMLYLPLPAEEGDYTLKIETSAASYEGHFSL